MIITNHREKLINAIIYERMGDVATKLRYSTNRRGAQLESKLEIFFDGEWKKTGKRKEKRE
ncbi:MAG: hypothetical protein ABID54_08890 [Pseudomonadota bacterium]